MKKRILALAACLLLCGGCTPQTVETPTPTPAVSVPDDPGVKTDWSHLTPYVPEEPIYTRRFAEFTDTLIPAPDYGRLVPFLGDKLGGNTYDGGRYGLVTMKGEIIADPVFATVWQGGYSFGYHDNPPLPYLLLTRGVTSAVKDQWPDEPELWAVAAADGSWCTDFKYIVDSEMITWGRESSHGCTEEGLFVLDGSDLVYLDGATGEERLRVEDIPSESRWYAISQSFWREGTAYITTEYDGDYFAVTSADAPRVPVPKAEAEAIRVAGIRSLDPEHLVWGSILFTEGESGIAATGPDGAALPCDERTDWYRVRGYNNSTGEKYVSLPNGGKVDFYDEGGELFASLPTAWDPTPVGGLFYVVTNTYSGLRAADGGWVFRYPLPVGEWD